MKFLKKIFPLKQTLEDEVIRLRLLESNDFFQLTKIAFEETIWTYFVERITNEAELKNWVEGAVYDYIHKQRVPFVIELKATKQIVGCTSYGNFSERDNRLEIGWTWLGNEFQQAGINQRAKNLLLRYAFEFLEVRRVEFKTDALNIASKKALKKLGATQEGTLRQNTLVQKGRWRDTVCFSILKSEWESRL